MTAAASDTWSTLLQTSASVRAPELIDSSAQPRPRGLARAATVVVAAGAALAIPLLAAPPRYAAADYGADATLFSLTNADRASNGVAALVENGTLQTIGEGGYYGGCGFPVHGRSVDMIQRNYFAHPILGCGKYVFSIMLAYGVPYRSAGENIGWVSGESGGNSAASYINGAFMNSPDHRANILNSAYTELGVGSDASAPGVLWTGAGSPGYRDVWMFSEEFAQVGYAPPPPPPPRRPRQTPAPNPAPAPRNFPAPPPPSQGPAVTPAPTPVPAPTATPLPSGVLPLSAPPPLEAEYDGLLPGSIESVLEAFLDD